MVWKIGIVLLAILALSEAKFSKYERLKEVFDYIRHNDTLLKLFKDHEQEHILARERYLNKTRHIRALHPFQCDTGYVPSTFQETSGLCTLYPQSEGLLRCYFVIGSERRNSHKNNIGVYLQTEVHSLRPEHISVIAAMGDSLTAGNGILGSNILDCLTEYRGRSWSIGGDLNFEQGVETLPNMLRKFNPNLKGYSIGKCDTSNLGCSQLNVAVAGETSQELPRQARNLIDRMKNKNFGVDFNNEWKLITVFIGGNDLCDYCHNSHLYSPSSYISKIQEALDLLHAEVPRAFVNLIQIFDITPLAEVSQGFFCNFVTNMVCDCAKNAQNLADLSMTSKLYQEEIRKLVATGRYDTRDDFTVVLQPFFQDTEPVRSSDGKHDLAYFAPDCFHFSDLGSNEAGKSLWNNMAATQGVFKTAKN